MRPQHLPILALFATSAFIAPAARAQHPVRHGISIGNYPRVVGVRINFRDRNLERVDGANITIWSPYEPATGEVHGLALGLPITGAGQIDGVALGVLGVGADQGIRGVGIGGLGVGSGGELHGLMLGGLGVGSGGAVRGIAIGGLGVGRGGNMRGLMAGGLGVGSGGNLRGISIGGLGIGGGGDVWGAQFGGLGIGAGGNLRGLSVAGAGIGAGGNATGIQIAGLGVGAGGTLRWVSVALLGVGAPTIEGFAAAAGVGGHEVRGVVLAPAYFRIDNDGLLRGVSVSTVNDLRGTQRGLTIGIVNYTRHLDGVQLGLVNIARDNPVGRRVLPVVNWNFR